MSDLSHLDLKLGKHVVEGGLDPVPRALSRKGFEGIPLFGGDVWNAYEVSFLLPSGVPRVLHMQVSYDASSANIVESKSFKLYLNSFNMEVFPSDEVLAQRITVDLSNCVGAPVHLSFYEVDRSPSAHRMGGHSIDHLTPTRIHNGYSADLLDSVACEGDFHWHSHLLRSRCPVTGQPDWGAVEILGRGPKSVAAESLLAYLIAMRDHQGFHEACCEMIFRDLWRLLEPSQLRVNCFYTRRGGLDINPLRANEPFEISQLGAIWRQ